MNDFGTLYSINDTVNTLGISPLMKGHAYLCRAVELACENRTGSADNIYTIIAGENETCAHCVERDIRTAIRDSQSDISRGLSVKKLIFILAEKVLSENL